MAAIFNDFINKINKFFNDFKKVGDGVAQVSRRFKHIKYGFDNSFQGIKDEFHYLGKSFELGGEDIGRLLQLVGQMVYDFLRCAYQLRKNMRCCFLFYIVDFIGKLLYMGIKLIIFILRLTTTIDLRPRLKQMNESIRQTDDMLHSMIGFYLARYPDSVIRVCYTCPNNFSLKRSIQTIKQQANDIDDDFNHTIPEWLNKPRATFDDAGKEFRSAFT
jgi:hypothetical protein